MWEYRARAVEVVDGDTIDVVVDLGFHLTRQIRLRLADVDTHEIYGTPEESLEHQRGDREAAFVREWLPSIGASEDVETWPLVVRTSKRGKYGRYIATVTRERDGAELTETLRERFDGVSA